LVTENWLNRMIKVAESNPSIGIVGPISNIVSGVQLDKNAKYQDAAEMYNYAAKIKKSNKGKSFEFPRVAFLCTLIKRNVLDTIGGLDERFSPGNFEDDDFCLRAQLAGFKTIVAEDVFIHHFGSISFKANGTDDYAKRLEHNKVLFTNKWGADPEEIWLQGKTIINRNLFIPFDENLYLQNMKRAMIYLEDKDYEQSLASLKEAINCYDSYSRTGFDHISKIELLNLAANTALIKCDYQEAKEFFEMELQADPTSSRACTGLAEIFFTVEMYEESKTMFEWALKYNSTNNSALEGLKKVNGILQLEEEHNNLEN